MGKITKLIVSVGVVISFTPALASAQNSCTISNTGQNSNNSCTFNNSFGFTFQCVNGVLVNTLNNQVANSGSATVSGNTGGGSASSGNVLNEGQITTNVNSTCAAAAAVNPPANPTTPSAPTVSPSQSGGRGGAMPSPTSTAGITSLPETGTTTPLMSAIVVLGSVFGVGLLAQIVLSSARQRVLSRL